MERTRLTVTTATQTPPHTATLSHQATSPRNPLTLWHLLSLDAPTVAALWTWFIASANHLHLPAISIVAMFLAVWMLYAADRLLDARYIGASTNAKLEARHYFHNRHRRRFLTGILSASVALAILLPHLEAQAIHLYLILGGLLCGYFILIHATSSAHRLPKEIAVGLFFAAATFIPTIARRPDLRISLLPLAILFATACSLNCLFIYAWEHSSLPQSDHQAHAATHLALRNLPLLTTGLIFLSAALTRLDHQASWPIPFAIAVSATSLLLLHRRRHHTGRLALRSLADLAFITPLLLLPFLPR
ncbi:hypothetical protein [Tunturiibacter gelidoferens]|uniref:Prenyltransferase n=1 Tax=Tunturiibacter lichenicola TaxID=2051959 RepID=A0A7Y9NP99_9BACT|nr:hypothetical protein [Edaphobacter lichenicola]NYF52817.1 hypothetical protein [Edaphobacter lichenicola]